MSKLAALSYDIQELFIEGHNAYTIAQVLECPIEMVLMELESYGVVEKQQEETDIEYYGA